MHFKLLVLTPNDKDTGAVELWEKKIGNDYYHNFAGIVLQDGLTLERFLSDDYKTLREATYWICKDKVILEPKQNELTEL